MYKNELALQRHKKILVALDQERQDWFTHWREIADFFLPRRYPWLRTQGERRTSNLQNRKLLDSTSTLALRTLASGMMSGITSPARPWFRLRMAGFTEESMSDSSKAYLEEVARRMALVLAESNAYNALAVLYLEWSAFGTASMGVYEDFNEVIRCFNFPLGEFYISQDGSQRVNRHGRRLSRTVEQIVDLFGIENVSEKIKQDFLKGDQALLRSYEIAHLIEVNAPEDDLLPGNNAPFREVYWEVANTQGGYLSVTPLYEWPTVTPRWELIGDDSYGVSLAMDCLNDVKELQALRLEMAQAVSKKVRPPLIVDQQMRNRPKGFSAGGITYASTANSNFGAKPAYSVELPFGELQMLITEKQQHIKSTLKNDLFSMISQLDTVRSATEIDGLREEKLVHLGPVFERFSNEGLDPFLRRVYGIMDRKGLLPPAPEELADEAIEVQYVSILSDAQRAAGTANIERFFQFTGSAAGVWPEARNLPNVEELIRDYAEGIGIKPSGMRSREQVENANAAEAEQAQAAQAAEMGSQLASGAKVLSDTNIGGGTNALQALLN